MRDIAKKLGLAAVLLLSLGMSHTQAQGNAGSFPSKQITIVVPYAAGGVADSTARMLAESLHESLKQPVVVENRAGAGGLLGAGYVARAPADGHTILMGVSGLILQPQLVEGATVDPFRDFAPITLIARLPLMLAVPKTTPATSLDEYVKWAKANPAKASIGNYGVGTPSQLLSIMLNQQAGTSMPLIPFQGSSQLASNLLGGQVSAGVIDSVTARQFGDRLNFLAVTGTKRLVGLPNLRTFKEQGFQSFEQDGWLGILVPASVPKPIIDKLSQEFERIVTSSEISAKIGQMGLTPVGSSPSEFGRVMRADFDVYGTVIKSANIRLH